MRSVIAFLNRNVAWVTVSSAIAGIVFASAGAWYISRSVATRSAVREVARPRRLPAKPVIHEENRKVYPYSIVPGGAKTVREAKTEMSDPSVKNHYAAIDLNKLRQVTLSTDLVGYVSYRYGDQIYWTAKKIHLKAGEMAYTDGTHVVRGRCLNCYSAYPMMPTRPGEPSQKVMDTPVEVPILAMEFPGIPLEEAHALPPPLEELTPSAPALPSGPLKPGGGFWFPLLPIIPPIHRHNPSQPSTGTTSTPPVVVPPGGGGGSPPPPPPIVTPEPQYLRILIGAFSLLIFSQAMRSRRLKRSG